LFKKLAWTGDVFVDVGANIGYYTLLAVSTRGVTGLRLRAASEHLRAVVEKRDLQLDDRGGALRAAGGVPLHDGAGIFRAQELSIRDWRGNSSKTMGARKQLPPCFAALVLRNLAVLTVRHGETIQAERFLEAGMKMYPGYAEPFYLAAWHAIRQQRGAGLSAPRASKIEKRWRISWLWRRELLSGRLADGSPGCTGRRRASGIWKFPAWNIVPDEPPPLGELTGPFTWFEPDFAELVRTLRHGFDHRKKAAQRGLLAAKHSRLHFAWPRITQMYMDRICFHTKQ
jgi:hypothetical protein